jgi:hypothetical protein
MAKVTFSLDDETVRQLRRIADRTRKPQSLIVREAIAHYAAEPLDVRISEGERDRKLALIGELRSRTPLRTAAEADAELDALRKARRGPARRHPIE